MNDYLSLLPKPQIIEELSFETILAALVADAVTRFAAAGVVYDVGNLETDPVKIVLEAAAYREVSLRARANDVARAQILSFALLADLDHLANFYEVTRLEDETDDRLRDRVVDAIRGRSPAGSEYWYRSAAMKVSTDIRNVAVRRVDGGPKIALTVLTYSNNGVALQTLLDDVEEVVTSSPVRVVSDQVQVEAAVFETVNVTANVWLLEGAPYSAFTALAGKLGELWTARQDIGMDLAKSWVTSALHQAGVQKVEIVAPAQDAVADANHAVALGTVNLTFRGYAK